MPKADFIEMAPLWRPRTESETTMCSGQLSAEAKLMLAPMLRAAGYDPSKCKFMVQRARPSNNDHAPQYRLTLVAEVAEDPALRARGSDFDADQPAPAGGPPANGGFDDNGPDDDPFA